jgi:hypothetical protein
MDTRSLNFDNSPGGGRACWNLHPYIAYSAIRELKQRLRNIESISHRSASKITIPWTRTEKTQEAVIRESGNDGQNEGKLLKKPRATQF